MDLELAKKILDKYLRPPDTKWIVHEPSLTSYRKHLAVLTAVPLVMHTLTNPEPAIVPGILWGTRTVAAEELRFKYLSVCNPDDNDKPLFDIPTTIEFQNMPVKVGPPTSTHKRMAIFGHTVFYDPILTESYEDGTYRVGFEDPVHLTYDLSIVERERDLLTFEGAHTFLKTKTQCPAPKDLAERIRKKIESLKQYTISTDNKNLLVDLCVDANVRYCTFSD
jgi:hypothetical protein